MRETFPTKLLLLVLQATPDQLVAIERFLGREPLPSPQERDAGVQARQAPGDGSVLTGNRAGSRYQFRRKGRLWEIVFDGRQPFCLKDTLGIRYLDYLLHCPNEPISAFDLEVAITPEKGEARALNSIQPQLDGQARREYRQTLGMLHAAQEQAQATGDSNEVRRLDGEIQALESALNERGGTADAGERARINVHKAIKVVLSNLLCGDEDKRAFRQHIREAVSLGYKCLYNQPEGRIWD